MIEYKTKASEANLFLSENDINFPIHHYMYVHPKNFDKVTLDDIIKVYQKYELINYKNNVNFILDPSIPENLNINSNMKFSEYIKIDNTENYHLLQGDYYYIPIIKSEFIII